MAVDDEDPPEAAEPDIDELDATDAADMHLQDIADDRAWVHTALAVIQARFADQDASGRVQLSFDKMSIAAAERIVRCLRKDLAADKG